MTSGSARVLLTIASFFSAAGGAMHALAFRKTATVIAASNLPHFYAGSANALWLADSATLLILAIIFGLLAARPSTAVGQLVMWVALVPAATAVMMYTFLGNFFPEYILLAIAALSFIGGSQLSKGSQAQKKTGGSRN
jgi:hypothetical protein